MPLLASPTTSKSSSKEGNDSLYGGKDDDFLNGGEGDDVLEGGKGSDFLIGGNGRDNINGGKDDDILSGGAGNDLVRDTQGNNALYGNNGDDLLFAGNGDDALYGDAGNDRLIANNGSDLLFGGSGDDYLNGGAGDDNLIGMEGDDTLIGSSGSNILSGGDGSDRFVLSTEGTAIITDFTQNEDFLELSENISFNELEIIQGSEDNADNTLINWRSTTLAVLDNVDSTEINTSDFINLFPTFSLQEPTGEYAVGTTSYHFIDSEREETYTADPNDNREITAKVWYPSIEVPQAETAPYFSEELSSAIALGEDIPPEDFIDIVNSIPTNGYSLGGATAAKVLSVDSRFQAGINLDGGLFGDVTNASLSQPFMFLNNEAFGTEDSLFNQLQQSFVENLQNNGYEVTISGTIHPDFNDTPFLSSFLLNSGIELGTLETILDGNANNSEDFEPIDPNLAAQIINDYTVAFPIFQPIIVARLD